jgi:hypothetical protein
MEAADGAAPAKSEEKIAMETTAPFRSESPLQGDNQVLGTMTDLNWAK